MRVRRAFGFVDLVGFSNLTAREGDERAVLLAGQFRALVREICSRRGVRIAKWLGDGAMLVGVETSPLLGAVLELQHAATERSLPAQVCCGATTGSVLLLEGDDYIGHAVNVAARLCDLAQPKEVLATTTVVGDLPPWATVLERLDVRVRGIDEALAVARLGLRPTDASADPDPVCGICLTPQTAVALRQDSLGQPVLLCSDSCLETWEGRPAPTPEEQGSLRVPLIGS